jgi:signal transduction histidine kinase
VKVATRITVATAVVVALASATYAFYDLRSRVDERKADFEREARALAGTVRVFLEASADDAVRNARYRAEQLGREIEAIDKRLAEPEDPNVPPAELAAFKQQHVALQRQRTELEPKLQAARSQAGIPRALDLALAYKPPSENQLRELTRASAGWRVVVIPRVRAASPPGMDVLPAQLRRVQTLLDVPERTFSELDEGQYLFAIALFGTNGQERDPATGKDGRVVIGMLELTKSADTLAATSDDVTRAAVLVMLIVIVTTVMVGALASRFVSRPITKLLRGIDDVAKGDLSHAILSERDDEIGAIATRFNDMTYSLRESRAETQRHNEARFALEQRLGQSEKLATIGQLAAEIAHEVGTPLNVIAGRARSIQKKSKDPEAVEKNAEIVAEQTARITRIIQRLLDFTRRKVGHHERAEVDLADLVATTLELLAGQFSAAKVRTKLERGGMPRVAGDRDRLQQVLINLLLNAVQAMPDGGAINVELAVVKRARPGLEGNAEQAFARCSVADTGIGIPPEIRDKIFDPFYTTKEGQGGTGLGLAVCSGIVKEHDGFLEIEDAAGGGTVFRVYLPA